MGTTRRAPARATPSPCPRSGPGPGRSVDTSAGDHARGGLHRGRPGDGPLRHSRRRDRRQPRPAHRSTATTASRSRRGWRRALYGGAGDDVLRGAGGLLGGAGNDTLIAATRSAARTRDLLSGGSGNDVLRGSNRPDMLNGGTGRATRSMRGGPPRHRDVRRTGGGARRGPRRRARRRPRRARRPAQRRGRRSARDGDDVLRGTAAADSLNGGKGRDRLFGRSGRDVLVGGSGADLLVGGDGGDRLEAGTSGDRAFGGTGDDELDGDVCCSAPVGVSSSAAPATKSRR